MKVQTRSATIEHTFGHEVLQPTALNQWTWPNTDPSQVTQPCRLINHQDDKLIAKAASLAINQKSFDKQTQNLDTGETIFHALSSEKVNFNGTTRVRQEKYWLEKIKKAVQSNRPVDIAYPLMCKIPNGAKQMSTTGVTAGEEVIIRFFDNINAFIKTFYEPGLQFNILCDANLYNTAFQSPVPVVNLYIKELRESIKTCKANDCITLYDYAELLSPYAREYQRCYNFYFKSIKDNPQRWIDQAKYDSLSNSVYACINTHRFGFS